MKSTSSQGPSTHLDAPEDAVGVYSVLGSTENGCGVVIALIPRAVATNTKKGEQGSGWSTGAIWKCASAAEGMVFKSSQGKSWFLPHSTGAILEAGLCDGRGCSILMSPPRSPPSSSDSHTHRTVWVYASLRQARKSHSGRISSPASCSPFRWQG